MDQLEPYQDFGGYQIRIPKGWEQGPNFKLPSTKTFDWCGPMRADGTRQTIVIVIASRPSDRTDLDRLNEMFHSTFRTIQNTAIDLTCNAAETGQISGITFMRIGWQGKDSETKVKLSGLNYVGKDSQAEITMIILDAGPEAEEMLKLATAATLTLRKKQ